MSRFLFSNGLKPVESTTDRSWWWYVIFTQGFLAPKHKMETYMNTESRRSYGRATLFEKQAWDWEAIIRNIPWDWEDIYYMYMCIY